MVAGKPTGRRWATLGAWLPPILAGLAGGCFGARVIFEAWPEQGAFLATWAGTAAAAAACALLAIALWRPWSAVGPDRRPAPALLPFSLLLIYIFWPQVHLLVAGALLVAAVGLSLALGWRPWLQARGRLPAALVPAALALTVLVAYLRTMGRTVGEADTFEFQVVAPQLGIAHPTGYPLFMLLGKLFSLIPLGSVAWRVNLVSVVCATAAVVLVYTLLVRVTGQRGTACLAAASLAFSRVYWSQAISAEVYALNAAFVTAALALVVVVAIRPGAGRPHVSRRWLCALAAVLGLGLTHHLTMVLVVPAILLGLAWVRPQAARRDWLLAAGVFVASLSVELYFPLRWPAINGGQALSLADFAALVTGRRFGGALQPGLWSDPTRWGIVGRTMLAAFGPAGAALALAGCAWLVWRRPAVGLVMVVAWLAYFAYGLIYNVSDVSVFVLPAHLIMALWIGVAAGGLAEGVSEIGSAADHGYDTDTRIAPLPVGHPCTPTWRWPGAAGVRGPILGMLWVVMAVLPLGLFWTNAALVDQSEGGWKLYRWGQYVLSLPLPSGSVILADSEKIAPLYYLGKIEHVRPDVETMVLGDEDAYRAELGRRVAAGQPTYLARYLPGLAGQYHLSAVGPLVRVTSAAEPAPDMQKRLANASWGGHKIALLGYTIEPGEDDVAWRVTLFWSAPAAVDADYHVRLRWVGSRGEVWWEDPGERPANGYSSTVAWEPGEVVADYHEIPADPTIPPAPLSLEVGLFVPFRDEGLTCDGRDGSWYPLERLDPGTQGAAGRLPHELRASYGDELAITGASDLGLVLPGETANLTLAWSRLKPGPDRTLILRWGDRQGKIVSQAAVEPYEGRYGTGQWPVGERLQGRVGLAAPAEPGTYTLQMGWSDGAGRELTAHCGWLASPSPGCVLATVRVQGSARERGVSFDDQVLLLGAQIEPVRVRRGQDVNVALTWQGLRAWPADYTAFVHLVGPDGKLHGQVDQWPVEGTLATTDWQPGRIVNDPYRVPLAGDAPAGTYQVEVGWYLLTTLRRLPVLDSQGRPVDDRVVVGTVTVAP